jgi:phosphate transport system protein
MSFEHSDRAHILEERLRTSIDTILRKTLEMGELAEQAVERSLKALLDLDRRIAYSVILRDHAIDSLEKEIDRLCLGFLVREQPAAGHLRFAYATIKINTGLERVGDYAESVARQVLFLDPKDSIPCRPKFLEIGELSRKMLHDSLVAFTTRDVGIAKSTLQLERQVDDIRSQIRRDLLQMHREGHAPLELVTPLTIAASRFERVADQAVGMCEEVVFLCTGEVVKHPDGGFYRVLFLSEHDSIRGPMAEGIARSLGLSDFAFASAGLTPHLVDTRVTKYMAGKGIDISDQTSKSIAQIPDLDHYQVIVLLGRKAGESAPNLPAKAVILHWPTPEPSEFQGTDEQVSGAFDKTYADISAQIRGFVQAVVGGTL